VAVNKRAAIALAGGVTGALVTGVAGYSLSLTGDAPAAERAKPIVRTEVRTITIHRKAKAPVAKAAPVHTVVVHRKPSAPPQHTAPPVHHTGGSAHHGGDDEGEGGGGDD
jgi:hypothetical protein